ncbi:hypothetical protein DL546_008251 [Coniochaeta pulveracea]|uniref:PNPLA domain-containing protein n=1 Tax=Coniochaeta pulveracea TaxID=177199 RepID=A0A420YFV2_9PEZI|nr:hypothetical protein DL546_008251 [Coniochaeta pulveracea]
MDSYGVKRKDTTIGPPLRILSLDGGGVRGYSMFLILQELMHRTFVEVHGKAPRRSEIPKPCDHFDLIVGTGTGGLIAIMLGRLRLDIETCKELYVRMTRMVFETDKTIAGIPYRSTLFKATKLEDAIKECVRDHTIYKREGNDGTVEVAPSDSYGSASNPRRHSSNASVVSFSARSPAAQVSRPYYNLRGGNPNARLYDEREYRTKTAVTAMYKGSKKGADPVLLRSYDSRREPAPEYDCKIWEAGRATCAIGLAFKPIQIGQSVFHDDGAGNFNPSPNALDEAVVNEWPGREIGVFFSVGTGKRPAGSDQNSSMWYDGFLGEYGEARKNLVAKIEGCEKTHNYMLKEHLSKRGVNIDNYYRLNVEVGVGEFGMNEWNRLADISTNTRQYLRREAEQKMVQNASAKLAKIHFAKQRWEHRDAAKVPEIVRTTTKTPPMPLAFELPAEVPATYAVSHNSASSRQSYDSGHENLAIQSNHTPSPRSSGENIFHRSPNRHSLPTPIEDTGDHLVVSAPTPAQYRNASGADLIAIVSADEQPKRVAPPIPRQQPHRIEPPPLPPKTPLPDNQGGRRSSRPASSASTPYPLDDDEPPPVVNMARKPDYRGR